MNFHKLIEDECNRVNPIVQLAESVTRDHAQQESIGVPLASNQLEENLPQSFNMNEIMSQIQGIESQNAAVQYPHDNPHIWAPDYDNQIIQPDQNPYLDMMNTPHHGQNDVFGYFFPTEEQHFGQSLNIPLPPVYLPVGVEYYPNTIAESNSFQFPPQLQEIGASESEVHEQNNEESHSAISESEDHVQNEIAYLHYRGLSVEDVNGTTDLGVEFTEVENFYNFVENYVIKYNGEEYKKIGPRSIPTNFTYYEVLQSPFVMTAKRVFDDTSGDNDALFVMPFNENNRHKSAIKELCDGLVKNEKYQDAIKVLEDYSISFKQSDCLYIFLLADLYLHEHSFYQACQTLFTWLKNDPDYQDIVPPYFAMEDKDDGTIEKETLNNLKRMFIRAAQRRRRNPDFRVQMALAKLCQVDRDYDKSVDCMKFVLNNTEFDKGDDRFPYLLRCLSDYLALSNKPSEARDVLDPINFGNLDNIDVLTKIGLIALHQGNYRSAFTSFLDVVTRLLHYGCDESRDNLLVNSWTRLRLCVELMGRDNLCQAVDERDLNMLTISGIHISCLEALMMANLRDRHEDD